MREEKIRRILSSVCDEMMVKYNLDYNTVDLFYSLFIKKMGNDIKFVHFQDTGINNENIAFGICGSLFVIGNQETKELWEIPYLEKLEKKIPFGKTIDIKEMIK